MTLHLLPYIITIYNNILNALRAHTYTYDGIDVSLADFAKIFKFGFVHMGGDEVNTCEWLILIHQLANSLSNITKQYYVCVCVCY